ncbi:MAG TPA: ATPase domain-containing protein [Thermoanaerobaculia bacterium]|jgi:circadian clock protein KaiC|nr:ATPase domain-containing protein [Thermoanaerobaculia bacterium]
MSDEIAATGVAGLDEILRGGLPPHQMYLIQGDPGAGKTTLAFQFLLEGVRRGEKALYVTLSASERDLSRVARSHGWDISGIDIYEQFRTTASAETTVFRPSEVELGKTVKGILAAIEERKPDRVVIDSLGEIRLLADTALRYRKQLLTLKEFFRDREVTALVLDDRTASTKEAEVQGLAEGVIRLSVSSPMYGNTRRSLEVVKMRGVGFRGGSHDFAIQKGGMVVFPRLSAGQHVVSDEAGQISSGIAEIDALVGGGLERGSATMVMGPAGVGKSSLALQFAVAATAAGGRVCFFIFEEHQTVFLKRAASLGFDVGPAMEKGLLSVQQIDPAEMSAGEFSHAVRTAVETQGSSMIVIDSLNGYFNSMPEEHFLTLHLHELLSYLVDAAVTTIVIVSQHGALGHVSSPVDVSYLADAVILLRYYEVRGGFGRAISMLKKRTSAHEQTIREYRLTANGVSVGPVLEEFRGILSGMQSADVPAIKTETLAP